MTGVSIESLTADLAAAKESLRWIITESYPNEAIVFTESDGTTSRINPLEDLLTRMAEDPDLGDDPDRCQPLAIVIDALDLSGSGCCLCSVLIEKGFVVTDDEGHTYCEECWQP